MRDIEEQTPFGSHQSFDPVRHLIERAAELTEFVAPAGTQPYGEVAPAEGLDCIAEAQDRIREAAGEGIAQAHQETEYRQVDFGLQKPADRAAPLHEDEKLVAAVRTAAA